MKCLVTKRTRFHIRDPLINYAPNTIIGQHPLPAFLARVHHLSYLFFFLSFAKLTKMSLMYYMCLLSFVKADKNDLLLLYS